MNITELTQENFAATIEKHDVIVADFWAEWCAPCHAFSKIFEEVAGKNPDVFFGKINTEKELALATDFNIRSIPTIMLMRQKVVLFLESGVLPAEALQDLIDQAKKIDMSEVLKNLHPEEKES